MSKKKVAIISLGWLGSALFQKLQDQWDVRGSYHQQKKNTKNEFYFDINSSSSHEIKDDFDIIVFAIPPSKIESIAHFKSFIEKIKDKKLIFISSTSVYGHQGEVNEETLPIPETKNGKFLIECEKIILTLKRHCIIRSTGQYGNDRHPAKFLSGKNREFGVNERVNLIDLESLLEMIEDNLLKDEFSIINAVNTHHPLKTDFYKEYCSKNKLESPQITLKETGANYKVVSTIHPQNIVNKKLI